MRTPFTPVTLSFVCLLAFGCQATESESLDIEFRLDIPPCPDCGIVLDDDDDEYVLLMEVHGQHASATVTDPALEVIDPSTQNPFIDQKRLPSWRRGQSRWGGCVGSIPLPPRRLG